MRGGDIITKVRDLIAESSTRRFSDALILSKASDAQRQISLRLDYPEAQMRLTAISGVREYQLPALVKILRVYMLGPNGAQQAIYGTDIPTIEGQIQGTYSDAPVNGSLPGDTPWLSAAAQQYPVVTASGGFIGTKDPYAAFQRPGYYMRGGYIGFVIPPLGAGQTVIVDYVPSPPDLVTAQDVSDYPDLMKDAVASYVASEIYMSLQNTLAADFRQRFENEIVNVLQPWLFSMQANRPKLMVPVTRRERFQRRGYR